MPENIKRKTKEEILAWVADKKRKTGDKLVVADENTPSASVSNIKKEVVKL